MTNVRMYFAVGLLTLMTLIGILVNIGYFVANGRITRIEGRLNELNRRLAKVEENFGGVSKRLEIKPGVQP